jgi:hypothetical protein
MLIWIGSIYAFSVFINNAINNSASSEEKVKFDYNKVISYLLSGLLIIFVFEYAMNSWYYGAAEMNAVFAGTAIPLISFMVFISRRLGNIDIVQNEWEPVRLFTRSNKGNFNKALGLKIQLQAFRSNSILQDVLPIGGEVVKRVRLSDSNKCFLVKLDHPIDIDGKIQEYVYIKTKEDKQIIENDDNTIVYLLVALEPADYTTKNKNDEIEFVDWAIVN